MAIVKVADRGQRNSSSTGDAAVDMANAGSITVGAYLIARVAADNAGGGGAALTLTITDPRSNTWSVGTPSNRDPGAASAGVTTWLCYVKVTNAYTDGDDITFDWSGTPGRSAIVIEEWQGIHLTTPEAVARVSASNISTTAQPSAARSPSAANQLMYASCGIEGQGGDWGAQDTDTTNGSWTDLTKDTADSGTHDTSISVYGGAKVVSASGAQTWNNTLGVTGDWASVGIVFDVEPDPVVTPSVIACTVTVPSPTLIATDVAGVISVPVTVFSPTLIDVVFPDLISVTATVPDPTVIAKIVSEIIAVTSTVYLPDIESTFNIPTDIAGCVSWFDADDASTFTFSSGVIISNWANKGSGGDLVPGGGGSGAPSLNGTLNGRDTVVWNGSVRHLRNSSALAQPITLFLVAKSTDGDDQGFISDAGTDNIALYRFGASATVNFWSGGPAASYALDYDDFHLFGWVIDGSSSQHRIDQAEVGTGSTGSTAFANGVQTGDHFSQGSGVYQWAECVIYDSVLSPTQIDEVEQYLFDKWFSSPDETVESDVISVTTTVNTPTLVSTTIPDLITVTSAVLGPTLVETVTPSLISVTTSVNGSTGIVVALPAVISATTTVGSPTEIDTSVTSTITVLTAVQSPTPISSFTPSVISVSVSVQGPTLFVTSIPSVINIVATVGSPTIDINESNDEDVIPDVIALSVTVLTPEFSVVAMPGTVSCSVVVGSPETPTSASGFIQVVATVNTPGFSTIAFPGTIEVPIGGLPVAPPAGYGDVLTPGISASSVASPDVMAVLVVVPLPVIQTQVASRSFRIKLFPAVHSMPQPSEVIEVLDIINH